MGKALPPPDKRDASVHPGEVIRETLRDRKVKQVELARRTGYTAKHVSQVIHGRATISADFALAVTEVLGIPAHTLLRMQADHSLWEAAKRNERTR